MRARLILTSLIGLSVYAPVSAQQVEVAVFDGEPQDLVIHVGRAKPASPLDPAPQAPDLSSALASDFSQIGMPASNEPPEPVSMISVPHWMKSGSAASFGSIAQSSVFSMSACGDISYLARPDLPLATELRRAQLFPLIAAVACEHQIPVGLFDALIWQESRYQIDARSPKGAIGLAQLMPGTVDYLGVSNPWDVVENLRGGARYLRMQIDEFRRYDLALAAYNAGPGRVRPNRRIPRIRETIDYVQKVTAAWAIAERRSAARLSAPLPSIAHNPFRGVVVADYTSTSVANPR